MLLVPLAITLAIGERVWATSAASDTTLWFTQPATSFTFVASIFQRMALTEGIAGLRLWWGTDGWARIIMAKS